MAEPPLPALLLLPPAPPVVLPLLVLVAEPPFALLDPPVAEELLGCAAPRDGTRKVTGKRG
jgi:hypothetical protein